MDEARLMLGWMEGEVKKYHFACDLQTEKRLLSCGLWRQTKQCTSSHLKKERIFDLASFFYEVNLLEFKMRAK